MRDAPSCGRWSLASFPSVKICGRQRPSHSNISRKRSARFASSAASAINLSLFGGFAQFRGIGLGSPVSLERGGIARRSSGTLFACMARTFVLYLLCLGTPYQWGATVCTLVTYALLQLMGLQRKNVSPTGNGHRSWCLLWHLRTAGTSVCSVKGDCKPPSFMRGFMTTTATAPIYHDTGDEAPTPCRNGRPQGSPLHFGVRVRGKELDIVHRFATAGAMALCQFLNGCRIEHLLCHFVNLLPDFTQCASRRELAKVRVGQAFHGRYVPFERLHDLAHGNMRWWFCKHMAAFRAAHTFDQSLFTQRHQNLVEILLRYILATGNIRTFNRSLPIISGHVKHGTQAIIAFHC